MMLRLLPLKGKYYGTWIVDDQGNEIAEIWLTARNEHDSVPSPREEPDMEVHDSHYENQRTYNVASKLVLAFNLVYGA